MTGRTGAAARVLQATVAAPHGRLRLPHRPDAVGDARRQLTADLRRRGVDEALLAEVAVVASELLGNAVRHARPLPGGFVLLCWQVEDGVVHLQVTDGGAPGAVRVRRAGGLAVGGRGMRIVAGLSTQWGAHHDASGRGTVWAALADGDARRRPA